MAAAPCCFDCRRHYDRRRRRCRRHRCRRRYARRRRSGGGARNHFLRRVADSQMPPTAPRAPASALAFRKRADADDDVVENDERLLFRRRCDDARARFCLPRQFARAYARAKPSLARSRRRRRASANGDSANGETRECAQNSCCFLTCFFVFVRSRISFNLSLAHSKVARLFDTTRRRVCFTIMRNFDCSRCHNFLHQILLLLKWQIVCLRHFSKCKQAVRALKSLFCPRKNLHTFALGEQKTFYEPIYTIMIGVNDRHFCIGVRNSACCMIVANQIASRLVKIAANDHPIFCNPRFLCEFASRFGRVKRCRAGLSATFLRDCGLMTRAKLIEIA